MNSTDDEEFKRDRIWRSGWILEGRCELRRDKCQFECSGAVTVNE